MKTGKEQMKLCTKSLKISMITKSLLSLILMLAFSINISAYDFKVDGLCYNICPDSDNVIITYELEWSPFNYNCLKGDIIIPAQVSYKGKSYTVTQIGSYAFYGCSGLMSVNIPNSVTEIDGSAFEGCTGLASVIIPNSVTKIGGSAFEGCTGLTSVSIPNSVTEIGKDTFAGCTGLTLETIPYSVKKIGEFAFYGCMGLTSITIPNSVTEICDYAFAGCTGLTSITIPNSVTEIGDYAFEGCINLLSISVEQSNKIYDSRVSCNAIIETATNSLIVGCLKSIIPANVRIIGVGAFKDCTGLTSIIIPDSVTEIGDYAFEGCTGLTSVIIPNSVTEICDYAFAGCTGLTSITIPNSVTEIGHRAFEGCTGLTSITIPNSVTKIDAFEGCTGLMSVIIPNSVTEIDGFEGCTGLMSITIPNSVTEIGLGAFEGCTGLTSISIPNSVTEIHGFEGCTGLTSITIPNSVTEIGYRAFEGCTGLTSITIPNLVTEIGHSAFKGCTGLTSISIPNLVTGIGDYAFEGCTGLTSITIPNSVTEIGDYAFKGCTGLTSITIPNLVTKIGHSTFEGCTGLTSITIPNSVTEISDKAFRDCSDLTSAIIPNSVRKIGEFAFDGCTGLTSITIPNSVTEICDYAFAGCTGLTSITIPNSVTEIGGYAFEGCTGLTSITIPNSVTQIGSGAFKGSTSLTSVIIPNSVTEIGDEAFAGCTGLTSITIPNSMTVIGDSAFYGCINVVSIICEKKNPRGILLNNTAFLGVNRKTCVLKVPSGTIASYESVVPWSYFPNKTEDGNKTTDDTEADEEESIVEQETSLLKQEFQQYYNNGQYDKAIIIGESLLAQRDIVVDSDYLLLIKQLVRCCFWEKNYSKACIYNELYIEWQNNSIMTAIRNVLLGNHCMEVYDYAGAKKYYLNVYHYILSLDVQGTFPEIRRIREIFQRGYISQDKLLEAFETFPDIMKILVKIQRCYIAQGKLLEAVETYLEINSRLLELDFLYVSLGYYDWLCDSNNLLLTLKLGDNLCNQGLFNEALKVYACSNYIYYRIKGGYSIGDGVIKERIGRCHLLTQEYDQALDYLVQSNEIFEMHERDFSVLYKDYKDDPEIKVWNKIYLDLVNDLKIDSAIFLASQGDFVTSYSCLKNVLDDIFKESIDFLGNNTSAERSAYWEENSPLFCEIYPYVVAMATDNRFNRHNNMELNYCDLYGDLYNKSALFAKGLLLTYDNEFSRIINESGDSILISRFRELEALKNLPGPLSDEQRMEIKEKSKELEKELIVVSKYNEFMKNLKLEWTDVQKRLGDDDIAIEFLSFPELGSDKTFYIALTVRKDYDSPHLVFLCEESKLKAAANKAYTNKKLSKLIWGKLSNELKGDEKLDTVKNIYFSPSGMLHQVAIESMPHWEKKDSLMNQCYNIYRLSSTRELAIDRKKIQTRTAAVYGDIEYDTPIDSIGPRHMDNYPGYMASNKATRGFDADSAGYRGKHWNDLTYAQDEVDSITSILKNREIDVYKKTQTAATETSFKGLMGQKKGIIHIATHGFCWNDSVAREQGKNARNTLSFMGNGLDAMTRSGLLFSGANNCFSDSVKIPDDKDDGVLTAYETSMLDLRGLDLLVLSACETGLGDISAEGVFGLQRGFKKAGARTVVMSLWTVNDLATRDMMTQFYRYWIGCGMSKQKAFFKAQQYIKAHDKDYKYDDDKKVDKIMRATRPHWAAFILLDALEAEP